MDNLDIDKLLIEVFSMPKSKRVKTHIGRRYGRLTITGFDSVNKRSVPVYECTCDCGRARLVNLENLRKGRVYDCGKCRKH